MSSVPVASDLKARAARLLEEFETAVAELEPTAQLELRPAVARVGEAIVSRALGAALGQAKAAEQEYSLVAAAGILGRSERWLRGHRRELRIGYQLNGAGPWRFTQRELDRVLVNAARRRR